LSVFCLVQRPDQFLLIDGYGRQRHGAVVESLALGQFIVVGAVRLRVQY